MKELLLKFESEVDFKTFIQTCSEFKQIEVDSENNIVIVNSIDQKRKSES